MASYSVSNTGLSVAWILSIGQTMSIGQGLFNDITGVLLAERLAEKQNAQNPVPSN